MSEDNVVHKGDVDMALPMVRRELQAAYARDKVFNDGLGRYCLNVEQLGNL